MRTHEGRQGVGTGGDGQVAFGFGPFEALAQLLLADRTETDQGLAHRFRFVCSGNRPL